MYWNLKERIESRRKIPTKHFQTPTLMNLKERIERGQGLVKIQGGARRNLKERIERLPLQTRTHSIHLRMNLKERIERRRPEGHNLPFILPNLKERIESWINYDGLLPSHHLESQREN